MPRTLLVAGTGSGLDRAAGRARALGLEVVVEDMRRPRPGRDHRRGPDAAEHLAVRATDVEADGILAASTDTVMPAAVAAARLGSPGPGDAAAPRLGNRIALRRRLADAGVPQPRFAAARTVHEGHAALATVGVPAVLKPAEPWTAFPVRRLESDDDLDASLYAALAASPSEEAIVERLHDGRPIDVACLVRRGDVATLATVDRAGADGRTLVYPSALFGDALADAEQTARHALHAVEVRNGVATVQLVGGSAAPVVLDVELWTPADPLDALVLAATGVDLLELAIRSALDVDLPSLLARPRFHQGAALAPTHDGRPPGYVVVEAATNLEALERAAAVDRGAQPDDSPGVPSSHAAASAASSPAERQTPPRSTTPSRTRK